MDRAKKIYAVISALNMLLYAAQGAMLGLDAGFTPLVLSNFANTALFSAALALCLANARPSILTIYAAAVASYITYRMWGPVMDGARSVEFRLAHALMITLAWMLFTASIPRVLRRQEEP